MNTTHVRLTRSASNKMLGGVCGGLADYFGIDPVLVRLIFVALVFAGGISVVLYPILWLIMPVADSHAPVSEGLQDMQQVAHHVRVQAGEGAQALRARVEAAFSSGNPQPRFDSQTGQPLQPVAGQNRNGLLGMVLVGVGVLMLASFFPGGSSAMLAVFFLVGGYYMLRRSS